MVKIKRQHEVEVCSEASHFQYRIGKKGFHGDGELSS